MYPIEGQGLVVLALQQGYNDGAGNPPNPDGLKTDYLWKEVLTPAGLNDILENYAQIVEVKHPKTGKKKRTQVFPVITNWAWCDGPWPTCVCMAPASDT